MPKWDLNPRSQCWSGRRQFARPLRSAAVGIRDADHVLKKLALTSPTSGGRSAGIVRSRTKATEFGFFVSPFVSGTRFPHFMHERTGSSASVVSLGWVHTCRLRRLINVEELFGFRDIVYRRQYATEGQFPSDLSFLPLFVSTLSISLT
jgi:hypothetical protein